MIGKIVSAYTFVTSRRLWLFAGSGLIVSVAYIDPGNWGTNIGAGSQFNYGLIWVIWMASGMAMLFQYLSGKIGIAGHSLPDLVRMRLRKKWQIVTYWFFSEVSILATDLAEFLGIVVALQLLFGIPLIWGTYIALVDVLLFFVIFDKTFRRFEQAFVVFVGIIGFSFLYELFLSKPDLGQIAYNSFHPLITEGNVFLVVGIIGATVMPHALFIHSWLTKNKMEKFPTITKKEATKFHLFDNIFFLTIAGVINAAMLIMAAAAFYGLENHVTTLESAYETLTPLFGSMASVVFGVALLSAGVSSSITGTLAGQAIMDSLLDFKLNIWLRRLITRVINVIPLTIAIVIGLDPLNLLIYSQVALSLLIPLPLIPIIYFSSRKEIMGEITNHKYTTIAAIVCAAVILSLNVYLLYAFFVGGVTL